MGGVEGCGWRGVDVGGGRVRCGWVGADEQGRAVQIVRPSYSTSEQDGAA